MNIDEYGIVEVPVDGVLERRRAVCEHDEPLLGRRRPSFNVRPEVRDGEMLVESIGGDCFIVRTGP